MITCLGLSPALDVTYGVAAVRPGEIHRPDWRLSLPGGKSLNVARAARRLGESVRAIAPVGGFSGEELRAALSATGVELIAIPALESTRTCVSVVDDAGGITEFYERVPELDDDAWRGVESALRDVGGGWLVVSGSVPPARALALAEALADAADRGVRLALDLRGEALEAVLARIRPALVKVNRAEAEETVGTGTLDALAARLRERGTDVAVVTDGSAGSAGADADGTWRVATAPAGRYTVGAGDSFLAGLVLALDGGAPLPDALRRASAVAAANTLVPGAAEFDAAAVDGLLDGVDVRPW